MQNSFNFKNVIHLTWIISAFTLMSLYDLHAQFPGI